MANTIHPDGFTDVDCANCRDAITNTMPAALEKFQRLKEAGFPLDEHEANARANIEWAKGLLRTYAPGQLPHGV
jgi:hypothetical protein